MLKDNYLREFKYLRLSVTEKCNFRCNYCLPNGYKARRSQYLNLQEITNLAFAFKELGIEKIRLTGGEPTLRPDLMPIIRTLKETVGIPQVALTTNGFRLSQDIEQLREAGLDSLNISMDSLQKDRFKNICGMDRCESIKKTIDRALGLGFSSLKLNCVLLKDQNDDEFFQFLEFVKSRDVTIRFIELMRTGGNADYFSKHHLAVDSFQHKLLDLGWRQCPTSFAGGPAKEFFLCASRGKVGFISPYQKDFCANCNRLRVSSLGGLRLCLFGNGDVSLRDLLQVSDDRERLKERICGALRIKPRSHGLNDELFGDLESLSAIGG